VDEPEGGFRPPYLPFKTFWTFTNDLLAAPLPPQIDRSLMTSKSGTDQVHLTAALKGFGLIDGNQTVTGLRDLENTDDQARARWLAEQIRLHYPAQVKLSEQNGTEQQLKESFRDGFEINSVDTLRKSITFFLHAVQQAGIPLSPHFPSTRSGSGAPGTPKPRRPAGSRSAGKRKPPTSPADNGSSAGRAAERRDISFGDAGTVTVIANIRWLDLPDDTFTKLRQHIKDIESLGVAGS
jgi:hypothetical protein